MIKAKLFEILKTFSQEDYQKFGLFVNSDYCNSSAVLRKLYAEILKYASGPDNENLTRENLFAAIYPGKNYREGTIVNLLSGLYKLSEEYIAFEAFKNEEFTQQRYTIRGLGKRNLGKFLFRNYTDMLKKLDDTKIQDDTIYYNKYELAEDYISYNNSETPFMSTELIQEWHDKFIDFTLIKILEGYVFMLNHKKYGYDHNFNMSFMNPVINFIQANSFDHAPSIKIYYNLMMLLKEDNEKYYMNLKELMRAYPDILKSPDRWTVYICLVNFCHSLYESGIDRERFSKEIHELHRTIIEQKIYIVELWYPFIHNRLYLNIIQNSLLQNDYEWTENFIIEHRDELGEEYKTSTFNLGYALFYFNRIDYEKTLMHLNKVQTDDPFYILQIKALTLQVFYELKLYDNAISLIDSYRHYIKEKTEIPVRYNIQHKNFVSIVNRLLKIQLKSIAYNEADFDLDSEELRNIIKVDWLQEKIEEVKNG